MYWLGIGRGNWASPFDLCPPAERSDGVGYLEQISRAKGYSLGPLAI